jgi:outer membrane protein OmpA-like peptidoglycan-associated protein
MIFTQIAGEPVSNPMASVYNQDIWYVPLEEDWVGDPVHPGYPLNNALPNSLVSVGPKPNEYIILNQFSEEGGMNAGFSRVVMEEDGTSLFPRPMHIYQFYLSGSDIDLTMTPDGQILVMSMNRGDALGRKDLYVCFYLRDNVWSAPMHMGNTLNTIYQETSPHISPDKRFLYFSSDRPGGVGGQDIYVSERLNFSWAKWSTPILLKDGVNTPSDESQPYFDADNTYLYFTSRKDGSSDIYRLRQTPRPRLKKPLFVRGTIINSSTGKPVHSELLWGQKSSNEYMEFFNTYTGAFEVSLTEYEPYKFQPRKVNHKAQQILVDPIALEKQGIDTLDLILYLEPKTGVLTTNPEPQKQKDKYFSAEQKVADLKEDKITFYNINFVKGEATILSSSRSALQYLHQQMIEHPQMEILIEGHTDNVGDEMALINLSLERARAIRDYLIFQGVSKSRMHIIGKGATEALFPNRTESGRQKNRRVEVMMINHDI